MNIDINKIKNRLLIKYPFFGSVVANLDYIESRSCTDFNGNPTAATDGTAIYYHPDFINSISEDEQTFVFAHEVCHVAFDHIFRSEGKDGKLWNIATDAVINALLKKDGLEMVEGGVDIPEAINYDAEEMYKKLLEEKQKSNQNNGQSSNNNQDQTGGTDNSNKESTSGSSIGQEDNIKNQNDSLEQDIDVGHDSHSMWGKAIEDRKKQESGQAENNNSSEEDNQTNSKNDTSSSNLDNNSSQTCKEKESILDKIFNRNKREKDNQKESKNNEPAKTGDSASNKQPDELTEGQKEKKEQEKKLQEEAKKMSELGEKKSFSQNKIERRKQLEELRESLAKQSRGAGTSTNSDLRVIENIGISTPLIDWRRLLKEAVKVEVDWSYRNAMVEEGVVTPYLEEIPDPETEILLDTSDSINASLLRNFLRECKNILGVSKLKVGCFDTRFYGFCEIKKEEDIDRMQFYGGGGTDFDTAVNAFSRRVENKIIFTDGDASMPSKKMDAIWIVFGPKKINPPGGKVIYVSKEQLNRLSFYIDDTSSKGKSRH